MRHRAGPTSGPLIRELRAGDEKTVEAVFAALTPEQRLQRFHVAMPRLPRGMLRRLADVDGHHRVALVVELDGRPIGIGRYARVGLAVAEVALAVAAEHTRRGLGNALVDALARHAALAGIERFVFEVSGTNGAALNLALSRGACLDPESGAVHGSARLYGLPVAKQIA